MQNSFGCLWNQWGFRGIPGSQGQPLNPFGLRGALRFPVDRFLLRSLRTKLLLPSEVPELHKLQGRVFLEVG